MTVEAQTKQDCEIHKSHVPRSHINEIHHIRPTGKGGADKPDNKKVVCATGHNNVHQLLDMMLKWDKEHPGLPLPFSYQSTYTKGERALALEGFTRIKEDTHGR